MLQVVNRFMAARSPVAVASLVLLLIAATGVLDHLTGYELSFSIFYLIPVALGSWYGGRALAIGTCIASASVWLAVDFTSGHPYGHPLIPLWNAGVRLGFFLVVSNLLQGLRDAMEQQSRLAERDGLTGILNVRTFVQRCEALFQLASRHHHLVALGYIDLDGFKAVNDKFGHGTGDEVLKAVAVTIAGRARASDLLARVGGDEFAIVLPETDLAGARSFFGELRGILLALAARQDWPIGFSIGVAVFATDPPEPEQAIKLADDLMYRVKHTGKNDVLFEERASGRSEEPAAG